MSCICQSRCWFGAHVNLYVYEVRIGQGKNKDPFVFRGRRNPVLEKIGFRECEDECKKDCAIQPLRYSDDEDQGVRMTKCLK